MTTNTINTEFLLITLDPKEKTCVFCNNAKKLLESREKTYTEIYVTGETEHQSALDEYMIDREEFKIFPQVFHLTSGTKRHIGGFTELMEYINKWCTNWIPQDILSPVGFLLGVYKMKFETNVDCALQSFDALMETKPKAIPVFVYVTDDSGSWGTDEQIKLDRFQGLRERYMNGVLNQSWSLVPKKSESGYYVMNAINLLGGYATMVIALDLSIFDGDKQTVIDLIMSKKLPNSDVVVYTDLETFK